MLPGRMRGLLARLPEPPSWAPWVRFVVIQTGIWRPFMQQCVQNSIIQQPGRQSANNKLERDPDSHSALEQVRSWSRAARVHLTIVTALYLYDLIKYRLLALLDHDLDYLDCLIPGRFRFVGRTNKISGEVVSTFLFWFLVYRWTVHLRAPTFKFFPLEFIMSNRQEIERHEREPRLLVVRANNNKEKKIYRRVKLRVGHNQRAGANQPPMESEVAVVNSIFYLKSPFDSQANRWILRPNRTGKNWLTLNLYTKFLFYCSLVLLIPWFAMLYWALGGSVLTNLGFEMSYPACAAWLRDRQFAPQSAAVNNYSHVYLAPRVLAFEVPIDDIPARIPLSYPLFANANLFSLARIAMDLLENHLFYLEYVLLFIAQFYMVVIHSMDLILNSLEIKARLVRLLKRMAARGDSGRLAADRNRYYAKFLEASHVVTGAHRNTLLTFEHTNYLNLERQHNQNDWETYRLRGQIVDLQAILADHFDNLTRGYNIYVSFCVYFLGICWLSYCIVICTWMSSIRSRAVEWEFLIAVSSATLVSLALMSGIALVRSQNLQLYPLIARAMALDSDWAETKQTWMILLRYFYPRPYYCFALFESTEISFLLCIKILSWIISAFVILANFFYMTRS